MRDFIKDESYFEDYLCWVDGSIQKFQLAIEKVKQAWGEDDPGVHNGYSVLNNRYLKKLRALYSAGRPIEEIEALMPPLIVSMEKTWNGSDVEQMLWVLSVVVMLEMEDDSFSRLVDLVRKHDLQNPIIELLIQGSPTSEGSARVEAPYNRLLDVIKGGNKQVQLEKLKEYLEKYWYDGNKHAGWHDTHHHQDAIYCGYWSFESGAVAKILGLDDRKLKDGHFYPYDLVHYKN
ncbi:MAG: PoNe immunity protein domain-containing protein [Bhargavaea sp.]